MKELSRSEMETSVEGGSWLADAVQSALCWIESHSKEIGEAYARVAADPSNFM